ncbi:Prolyl 3-hydroxylase 1 [Quillaja saponaria]|nr:Prolyl 3-hydroxylase 1 [Quillaja saponaria]
MAQIRTSKVFGDVLCGHLEFGWRDQASDVHLGLIYVAQDCMSLGMMLVRDNNCDSDASLLLTEPLRLTRGTELFDHEFVNTLHAPRCPRVRVSSHPNGAEKCFPGCAFLLLESLCFAVF